MMDKLPEMKESYLVMDNVPIHISNEMDKLITSRRCKCVYLLPYFLELNPIEQFLSIVKNKVKRRKFIDKKDLKSKISDTCDDVPIRHVKAFIQHSLNHFENCLNKAHT
jgi:transposase